MLKLQKSYKFNMISVLKRRTYYDNTGKIRKPETIS